MPGLGLDATRRAWRELRAAGVPTFARWAHEDARSAPPEPVLPEDLPEERWSAVLASVWSYIAACYRVEARLLGDLLRLRARAARGRLGWSPTGRSAAAGRDPCGRPRLSLQGSEEVLLGDRGKLQDALERPAWDLLLPQRDDRHAFPVVIDPVKRLVRPSRPRSGCEAQPLERPDDFPAR